MTSHLRCRTVLNRARMRALAVCATLLCAGGAFAEPQTSPEAEPQALPVMVQAQANTPSADLPTEGGSAPLVVESSSTPPAVDAVLTAADSGQEAPAPPAEPAANSHDRFTIGVGVGGGLGARLVRAPARSGTRRLDTGVFPTIDLSVQAEVRLRRGALLGVGLHYQTSAGLMASQSLADRPLAKRTSLRSQHVDFGLAPGYRFARSPASVAVRLFLGWGFRGLRSVVDIDAPAYTLHGPVFRPELSVPLWGGLLTLRLAPELLVIAKVGGALRESGRTAAIGTAWGGEASIAVRIVSLLDVLVSYRESHADLASSWGPHFLDVERFVVLTAVLNF